MDNLSIHSKKSLTDSFGMKMGSQVWRRFVIHYTPKHGHWLNQAESKVAFSTDSASASAGFRTCKL
jgi:hypothetical protein